MSSYDKSSIFFNKSVSKHLRSRTSDFLESPGDSAALIDIIVNFKVSLSEFLAIFSLRFIAFCFHLYFHEYFFVGVFDKVQSYYITLVMPRNNIPRTIKEFSDGG